MKRRDIVTVISPECLHCHPTQPYTALQSTTQHYTALYSATEHYTALHSTTQHYTALYSTTALHSTTQHYTALHSTTQHYTALMTHTLPASSASLKAPPKKVKSFHGIPNLVSKQSTLGCSQEVTVTP